jgi:hypothetical protein
MLTWFDIEPFRYWLVAWICFIGFLIVAVSPLLGETVPLIKRHLGRTAAPGAFYLAMALAFIAFRWPLFFYEAELNPDESQIIAAAITLQHDPVYWRSVNGATHGPLVEYPLLLIGLLPFPIAYGSARLIGAVLMFGVMVAAHRLLHRAFSDAVARIAVLPLFCFLAFVSYWDLVHYSSEHTPAALLAIGTALLGLELLSRNQNPAGSWRWLAGGVVMGAAPLAKLQVGPITLVLLIAAALLDLCTPRPWSQRLSRLLSLTLAVMIVPLSFLTLTAATGGLSYAWQVYFVHNVVYAGARHHPISDMLTGFWSFVKLVDGLPAFLAGVSVIIAMAVTRWRSFSPQTRHLVLLSGTFALASFLAVIFPGRRFMHYLLLLVGPMGLLAGSLFAAVWVSLRRTSFRFGWLILFLAIGVAPQIWSRTRLPHPHVGQLADSQAGAKSEVARNILRYASPGEPLGQWGWMARYHVQTQMPQATQEGATPLQIDFTPLRSFYRTHYLHALYSSQPPVFIDAVGPGNFAYTHRPDASHETWPELNDYIAAGYTLVADIDGTRIYVRNDRLHLATDQAAP